MARPQTPGQPGRLAVICMVPDPGHLTPLLKLAAQARQVSDVLVLVPDELAGLAASYGFRALATGPVRPAGGLPDLHRYIEASEWVRIASALAACQRNYFGPLADAIRASLARLDEALSEYRPTHVLLDDHMLQPGFREILGKHSSRMLFHSTAPNYRRHNTWSLKSCYWTGARAASHDVVEKTRNELRLRARLRQAGAMPLQAPVPVPRLEVHPTGINHLSTGTSYLERILLADRLLYSGEDRTVLPTVPPLQGELPQDLGKWLGRAPPGGVVYVSFGTMLRPGLDAVRDIVAAVLKHEKRVLLQYPEEFPATAGVRQEKWVAQGQVLSHPSVSLFVTHGGSASVDEALWCGKPMLCIAGVWDHYYNAFVVGLLGAGVSVPRRRLGSARQLSSGVRRALSRPHAERAEALAGLLHQHWAAYQPAVLDLFVPSEQHQHV